MSTFGIKVPVQQQRMNTHVSTRSTVVLDQQSVLPRVSVVIVAWNAKKYVSECLSSLQEYCADVCSEVIVVDNASTDGTPEMIATVFPDFKLIHNAQNYGFAKANNIGIAVSSGEYICLVNSDVKFIGNCISAMLRYMIENPDVAMLGPKMLGATGEVRRSTMRFPTVWNNLCRALGLDVAFKKSPMFGGWMMADFDHQSTSPVEVLNGWFLLVRKDAIERVGVLDPQFFMYGEDMDWCYRFRQCGKKVVFFAGAEAIHYGGASSSAAPIHFYLEQCRANWQYWCKHHGWVARAAVLGAFAIHHSIRVLGAACLYLGAPSQRPQNQVKMRRSAACLRWVGTPEM